MNEVNGLNTKWCIFFSTTLLVIILSTANIALADYNFEGVPSTDELKNVAYGDITGGVYVAGGDGLVFPPYTQSFNVPGDNVSWARLYVGVWGGNKKNTGNIAVTYNDIEIYSLKLEGEKDKNPNVYCSGYGVYWIYCDVTTNTTSGPVDVVVTTSGDIDGRIYGVVLVAVYEESNGEMVKYWINDGNPTLYNITDPTPISKKEAHADFSGINPDSASAARLTVAYLAGDPGQNDYLYFNDNKLNGDDVASSSGSFDLLTFDVTNFLEKSSKAKFDCGNETYIHPVLAVLTVYSGEIKEDSDLIIQQVTVPELCTDVENIVTANIANIGSGPAFGFSVALYSDGEIVSKAQVSSVDSEQNKSVDMVWTPTSAGQHVLRVMADHTDIVSELRENNNNNTPFIANILDRTPPNITISSPLYDQAFTSNTVTVKGTIEESGRNTTMLVNGIKTVLSGNRWSASVALEQGMNWIIVDAIDESNNTATEFIIVHCDYDGAVPDAASTSSSADASLSDPTNSELNHSFSDSNLTDILNRPDVLISLLSGAIILIGVIVFGIRKRT